MSMTINIYSRQLWRRFDGWIFRHYVDPYIDRMRAAGYRTQSICRATRAVGDYARWLVDDHGDGSDVSRETAIRFLSIRRSIGKLGNGDRSAIFRFLDHLREAGLVHSVPLTDPNEQILHSFSEYLRLKRGLHLSTIQASVYYARPFLREIWNGTDELGIIVRRHVIDYVQQHAHDHGVRTTQAIFTRLRAFLRFLFAEGLLDEDLSPCIPAISGRRYASLPKFLTPLQLRGVLDACDRTTSAGRRDYAVLLLLVRLGLRAHEVAKLSLEDIDWSAGVVSIAGKAGTRSVLPLPHDVGAAITDYLVNDRPSSASRQVFLRHETPRVGFPSAVGIIQIASRILKRAGITGIANVSSHAFRHTLATDMVRSGASLTEIGQILRHLDRDAVHFGAGAHVRCSGKGRKERSTPLTKLAREAIKKWLAEPPRNGATKLFPTVHGDRMSPDAVQFMLSKYVKTAAETCRSLRSKQVSPHTLRHSAAMELLLAGVDLTVIALWLGHESTITTQTYLHAHMALKEAALARVAPMEGQKGMRFKPDDQLLSFLSGL